MNRRIMLMIGIGLFSCLVAVELEPRRRTNAVNSGQKEKADFDIKIYGNSIPV